MGGEPAFRRELTDRDLAYGRMEPARWRALVSDYDTQRRLETLLDDFLAGRIDGRRCLDAGTGLGFFALGLREARAAKVVAIDIAPTLLEHVREQAPEVECHLADLVDLPATLTIGRFDVVVCSEAIEHTPSPRAAVHGLAGLVRPGGLMAISCPNQAWRWLLSLAQALGLRRHYTGYENWVRAGDLRRWLEEAGLEVLRAEGVHTVPWQLLPKPVLFRLDRALRHWNYAFAVNLAVLAVRPPDLETHMAAP